jgi:hypothetical protein
MHANQPTNRARREYDIAVVSLTDAEDLAAVMAAAAEAHPSNQYVTDALIAAERLVAEMEANLDDVMSRWTPEQCGL